jgi:hypothetical protein
VIKPLWTMLSYATGVGTRFACIDYYSGTR